MICDNQTAAGPLLPRLLSLLHRWGALRLFRPCQLRALHLDPAPLAPHGETVLEQLAVGAGRRDQLHRHAQGLDFKVAVLVVEKQLWVSAMSRRG